MKKTICKVEYNTESAEMIRKHTVGYFGDPAGYEETLYRTEGGKYFLYSYGGQESPYPVEGIRRLASDKAEAWLQENQ